MPIREFLNEASAAIAALASLLAAFAAVRSAKSAAMAQNSLTESSHVMAQLKLAETANAIIIKCQEINVKVDELRLLCHSSFIKNGSSKSSREALALKYIDDIKTKIQSSADYAILFDSLDSKLKYSTLDEIYRVNLELFKHHKEIEAASRLVDTKFSIYRNI